MLIGCCAPSIHDSSMHDSSDSAGLGSGGATLFVEGGRGSTQFVVVDASGTVLHKAYADGFPKAGQVPYDQKRAAAQQVVLTWALTSAVFHDAGCTRRRAPGSSLACVSMFIAG